MSSDGAAIARVLRRTPIYVDPAYETALPKARRDQIVRRIRRSKTPIFVILVPIVAGSTWQSSTQVTTVVQSYLGRDGAYVTLNTDFGDVFDVATWGGTDEQRQAANDAGWAVSYEKRYKTLAARLARCVDLIATGKGSEAYEQDHDAAFTPRPSAAPRPHAKDDDGFPVVVPAAAGAVVLAVAGLLWLRRRRARAAVEALRLPHTVFGTAREAGEDELRARAETELVALGESLEGGEPALDAYTAAGRAFDRARSTADLAGVLALVQKGKGGPPLCYFDPRHGEGVITVRWRAPGTRPRLEVSVCATCAKAVRDRRAPDVLLDRGRPYYEAATPWAETGYGQLGDLVGRVLGE
ncbi:hypothetical protein [Actinoallomurus iriomotensis]|uniref:Uncharacterized protein n=1 Tax=Actinoallomurus iriomotensis TaxID=478107 RepID=A0A9W6VLS3_9ACTN|nr:hypothetical protein [Actinoallomurus iriomotensis]GLY76793.1 hypothetical protein Airi01_050600 [Actinoallomurus iriomotensis]